MGERRKYVSSAGILDSLLLFRGFLLSQTVIYGSTTSGTTKIFGDPNLTTIPQTSGTPNTGNNWGCMFTYYWSGASKTAASPTLAPLELQQVDCSNPCTMALCGTTGDASDGCFQPSFPGKTLDLRTLYPFATSNYASILELYSQDALLAFDPKFCLLTASPCDLTPADGGDNFGTGLSAPTQNAFFQYVGIGAGGCASTYGQTAQGGATGDCSYAKYITAAHGPH